MKVAIMQPYFFPYIGYFQLLNMVDIFVLYDDVQYIQRGWINRNYIISKESKNFITIPVINNKLSSLICETEIFNQEKWRNKILNAVYFTYKRAPFFDQVFPIIEEVINLNTNYISEIAIKSIKITMEYLDIKTKLVKSSDLEYEKDNKLDKINLILSKLSATVFFLPPGSVLIYKKTDFNIPAHFLLPDEQIKYKQFSRSDFESNLSIIDILMFNTKPEIIEILCRYNLA